MTGNEDDKKQQPMLSDKQHASLYSFLQSMYNWFSRRLYDEKLKSYRPATTKGLRKSVIMQMRDHIDRAVVAETRPVENCPPGEACRPVTTGETAHKALYTSDGLGQSFHDRYLVGTHSSLAEKLVKTSWEHLHASIRASISGDKSTAKLHLEILDSALTELADFLPEKRYRLVLSDMQSELERFS